MINSDIFGLKVLKEVNAFAQSFYFVDFMIGKMHAF